MFDGLMSLLVPDEGGVMRDPPKYYLIDDEITLFPDSRGYEVPVRVRLWMAKDACPVALVSQVAKVPPRWVIICAANYILECLLAFSDPGFLYFEYGDVNIVGQVAKGWTQATFELFGHDCRQRLFRPYLIPQGKVRIEDILGQEVKT